MFNVPAYNVLDELLAFVRDMFMMLMQQILGATTILCPLLLAAQRPAQSAEFIDRRKVKLRMKNGLPVRVRNKRSLVKSYRYAATAACNNGNVRHFAAKTHIPLAILHPHRNRLDRPRHLSVHPNLEIADITQGQDVASQFPTALSIDQNRVDVLFFRGPCRRVFLDEVEE